MADSNNNQRQGSTLGDALAFLGILAVIVCVLGGAFYLVGWLVIWANRWEIDSDGIDKHLHRFGVGIGTAIVLLLAWLAVHWMWIKLVLGWHYIAG
jgi:hypothetical protein